MVDCTLDGFTWQGADICKCDTPKRLSVAAMGGAGGKSINATNIDLKLLLPNPGDNVSFNVNWLGGTGSGGDNSRFNLNDSSNPIAQILFGTGNPPITKITVTREAATMAGDGWRITTEGFVIDTVQYNPTARAFLQFVLFGNDSLTITGVSSAVPCGVGFHCDAGTCIPDVITPSPSSGGAGLAIALILAGVAAGTFFFIVGKRRKDKKRGGRRG